MKAKNRKTGEIVDLVTWSKCSPVKRSPIDWVTYIDSNGIKHAESLHFYFDFEELDKEDIKKIEDDTHWQDVRERAAIAALQGLLANPELVWHNTDCEEKVSIVPRAIRYADELVEKLKKE